MVGRIAENREVGPVALSGLLLVHCFPGVRFSHSWQRSCDSSDRG